MLKRLKIIAATRRSIEEDRRQVLAMAKQATELSEQAAVAADNIGKGASIITRMVMEKIDHDRAERDALRAIYNVVMMHSADLLGCYQAAHGVPCGECAACVLNQAVDAYETFLTEHEEVSKELVAEAEHFLEESKS